MSLNVIGSLLEIQLDTITPSIATAWENDEFTPPGPATPYQSVHLLPARPDNTEIGPQYVQTGLMQVTLRYPLNVGAADAMTRAELIKTTFYRGLSLTSGGITVTIHKTPEIAPGMRIDDRWVVPVRIPFRAPVNT